MGSAWQEFEERSNNRTGTLFAIGGVAAFAFLAFFHLYGDAMKEPTPQPSAAESTSAAGDASKEADEPAITSPPVPLYMGPPTDTPREARIGVYECSVNGQRVISDRPCGANARSRTLTVEEADPREAAATQQRTWALQQQQQQRQTYSVYQSGSTAWSAPVVDNSSQCATIDNEIEQINARMRAGGYGTSEGNWLRERWHKLKDQRYELRCGR